MATTTNPAVFAGPGEVFDPKALTGLSTEAAATRLREDGFNEIPSAKPRTVFSLVRELASEPVFLVLIACGSIYLFLGDVQEAAMLLGFVLLIACITLYQEHKTERTLEALRDLASPRALVIRDAKQVRISGREVVRGDTIMLSEGDRVPADGTLLYACNLSVDESLLTGESLPVNKSTANASDVSSQQPGGDYTTWVYS